MSPLLSRCRIARAAHNSRSISADIHLGERLAGELFQFQDWSQTERKSLTLMVDKEVILHFKFRLKMYIITERLSRHVIEILVM